MIKHGNYYIDKPYGLKGKYVDIRCDLSGQINNIIYENGILRIRFYFTLCGNCNLPPNLFYINVYSNIFNINDASVNVVHEEEAGVDKYIDYKMEEYIRIKDLEILKLPHLNELINVNYKISYNFETLEKAGFSLYETETAKFIHDLDIALSEYKNRTIVLNNIFDINELLTTSNSYPILLSPIKLISELYNPLNTNNKNYYPNFYIYKKIANDNALAGGIDYSDLKYNLEINYKFKDKVMNININSNDEIIKTNKYNVKTYFDFATNEIKIDYLKGYNGFLFPYSGIVNINLWFYLNYRYYYHTLKLEIQKDIIGPNSYIPIVVQSDGFIN